MAQLIEIATRTNKLPPPPGIVWDSMVDPHRARTRPWLVLDPGEVEPVVLEAERPTRVVWSSLWVSHPDVRIRLELSPSGLETLFRFSLFTSGDAPDADEAKRLRRRLSVVFFADLRLSYG